MYDALAHLEEDDYLGAAERTLGDKWQKSVMYGLIKVGANLPQRLFFLSVKRAMYLVQCSVECATVRTRHEIIFLSTRFFLPLTPPARYMT